MSLDFLECSHAVVSHRTADCFDDRLPFSTTDADKFGRERVGEDFSFAKFNKRICGPLLVMEKMLTVWRYCSSNLSLFHAQISFLLALQHLSYKKIA